MDILSWIVPLAHAAEGDDDSGDDDDADADTPTLTQADADRMLTQRLSRERTKHDKDLRKALGIDKDTDIAETIQALLEKAAQVDDDDGDGDDDSNGDLKAVEARWKQKLDAQTAELEQKAEQDRIRFRQSLIQTEVRAMLAAVNDQLTADGVPLLMPKIAEQLGIDDETLTVVPIDAEGNRATDGKGNELTTGDVMTALLDQFPSLRKSAAPGGSGAGGDRLPKPPPAFARALEVLNDDPARKNVTNAVAAMRAAGPGVADGREK